MAPHWKIKGDLSTTARLEFRLGAGRRRIDQHRRSRNHSAGLIGHSDSQMALRRCCAQRLAERTAERMAAIRAAAMHETIARLARKFKLKEA